MVRYLLNSEQLAKLNPALARLKTIANKRNQLVQGEWWFNVFENGQLGIRSVLKKRLIEPLGKKIADFLRLSKSSQELTINHLATVSARDLDQWAKELNDIANILDDIEIQLRYQQ